MRYSEKYLKHKWDAQDAIQEFYLELVKQTAKNKVYAVEQPESYVMAIAKHVVHNFAVSRQKQKLETAKILLEMPTRIMIDYGKSEDIVKNIERAFRAVRAKRSKEVLELYLLGYTQPEIAKILIITVNTVEVHLKRAKRTLKEANL